MPILRSFLSPTVGLPQPVALQRKLQQNMNQPEFYEPQEPGSPGQFTQEPLTGEYIKAQLEKYAQRPAPPSLEPITRVKAADQEIGNRQNFQKYYEMLNTIRQSGVAQQNAEQARAAFSRLQQLQGINSTAIPSYRSPTLNTGGFGAAGSGLTGSVPSNPAANFRFAEQISGNYGWNNPAELAAWYKLGMKESGWRNTAQNPTSTAFGIGQFLNSTWAGVGIPKTSDPAMQVEAMARYIRNRYGSPSRALAFHLSHNWY